MIVFESQKVRHVVARLDRGEDLHEALTALAVERSIGAAWITGVGVFESCELTGYDPASRVYQPARQVDAPTDIVNLTGNISFEDGAPSVHLHATVSRREGGDVELLGGRLVRGEAFACEVRLDIYDDIALGREHDPGTGLSLWAGDRMTATMEASPKAPAGGSVAAPHDAAPTAESPPPPMPSAAGEAAAAPDAPDAGAVSWAQVADASVDAPKPRPVAERPVLAATVPAAEAVATPRLSLAERRRLAKVRQVEDKKQRFRSEKTTQGGAPRAPLPSRKRKTEEEFFDELVPEIGDFVDHEVFGLCRVQGETQSGGLIIRLENGGRKAIKLDYLEVSPPRVDDRARKVFRLSPRRRR